MKVIEVARDMVLAGTDSGVFAIYELRSTGLILSSPQSRTSLLPCVCSSVTPSERVFDAAVEAIRFDPNGGSATVLACERAKSEKNSIYHYHYWVPERKGATPALRIFKVKLPDGNFSSVPFQFALKLGDVLQVVLRKNPHLDEKVLGEPTTPTGQVIDR